MAEERMLNDEILLGLIKANSGGGGGGSTDYDDLNNKPQIGGVTLSGNKSASDLGLATTTDLAGKQDTLTFDSVPTDGSTNPVESNGVYDALATKQNTEDNNLTTTSKTVVGAVNELKSGLTNLDNEVNGDAVVYPYADVITIEDAVPANLADCTVKIEPVQDLHGYDKPWVGGAGKNKMPLTLDGIKAANTSGTWSGNAYSKNSVTFTVRTDADGNVTGIDLSGTASSQVAFILAGSFPMSAGSYIINGLPSGLSQWSIWLNAYNLTTSTNNNDLGSGKEFTVADNDVIEHVLYIGANADTTDKSIYPMLRLSTETDATFAPYTNYCPITGHTEASVTVVDDAENPTVTKTYTIALGDTIYGGTVDFDSGVMTVIRVKTTVDDLEWTKYNVDQGTLFRGALSNIKQVADGYELTSVISSAYPAVANNDRTDKTLSQGPGISAVDIIDDDYADAAYFKTAMSDVEICYELATPFTIQLTPQQIQLLKGTNTLYASTGQISVTVNGVSGAIGSLQTQASATDEALAELAADIAEKLPTAPTTDGAYVLTVTVADGTPTYSWESAT